MNQSLLITQSLYAVLNFMFLILISGGEAISQNARYNYLGFGMIGLCVAIIACNIGFSLYSTIKDINTRCKNNQKKANKVKQSKES